MTIRITKDELARRIVDAARRKRPNQAGGGFGSISRRRGGQNIRSTSFRDASNNLLREIGEEIVEEAKEIYRQELFVPNTKYLPHSEDKRTYGTPGEYENSFDVTPLPGGARPSINIVNKVQVRKRLRNNRIKTYRYGDVTEYGRPALTSVNRMFKIALKDRYAKKQLAGSKSVYNPATGSFIKYDEALENYYQYTSEVPAIRGRGIIARAVDNVLGRIAGNEVRGRK